MRALVIDDDARKMATIVVSHAERHPISEETMKKRIADPAGTDMDAVGNDPAHVCIIPMGFRCVFSIEWQKVGMCRHLSISVDVPGRVPHPAAVDMIAELFGFTGSRDDRMVWIDDLPHCKAVNLLQPVRTK